MPILRKTSICAPAAARIRTHAIHATHTIPKMYSISRLYFTARRLSSYFFLELSASTTCCKVIGWLPYLL